MSGLSSLITSFTFFKNLSSAIMAAMGDHPIVFLDRSVTTSLSTYAGIAFQHAQVHCFVQSHLLLLRFHEWKSFPWTLLQRISVTLSRSSLYYIAHKYYIKMHIAVLYSIYECYVTSFFLKWSEVSQWLIKFTIIHLRFTIIFFPSFSKISYLWTVIGSKLWRMVID